jgi:hypothetical protein
MASKHVLLDERRRIRLVWLWPALVAAGVLGACGSHGSSTGSTSGSGASASSSTSGSATSSSSGSGGGTGGDGSCDGGPCDVAPAGLLDPDYTTTWNPGILADTPTGAALGPDGLPVRNTICASVPAQGGDATAAIQGALNGCAGKHQVVALAAGTYTVSATIQVPGGVVLRGAGADAASGTVVVSTQGGPVLAIGTTQDTVCYDSAFDASAKPLLAQDAMKETATLSVASAAGFQAGDLALVDQMDDAEVNEGDCTFFKRIAGYGVSERVEIASVSGSTLTLPILFNNSGGGNVIGYNYADNSWSCDGNGDDGFQEVNVDCHCAFPHMELMEGNWAPHMGATTTHGNAGYLTYFRNYASSQWSPSRASPPKSAIVWSQPFVPQYADVGALDFPSPDLKMTVIGNVLGSSADGSLGLPADLGTTSATQNGPPATSQVYTSADGSQPAVFLIDPSTIAWSSLWLTGNFDAVNKKVMWNASPPTANLPPSTQSLPASLYYKKRPGWWPAGAPWPWVGPDLAPRVGALPAKTRSDAFDYYESADASCTLDCGNYCCSVGPSCSL